MSDEALVRSENQLILVLPCISTALSACHKTLARGRVESEMKGAVMELRRAANLIEQINEGWP